MNVKMMLIYARLNLQDRNTNFNENLPRIFLKIVKKFGIFCFEEDISLKS